MGNPAQEHQSGDGGDDDKCVVGSGRNTDMVEEQRTIQTPTGICDICAEFYHFLVSGKSLKLTNGIVSGRS